MSILIVILLQVSIQLSSNLQGLNEAVAGKCFYYITRFTDIQNNSYIRLIARCGFSFGTMKKQIKYAYK